MSTTKFKGQQLIDRIAELGLFSSFSVDRLFLHGDEVYEYIGDVNFTTKFRIVTDVFNADHITDDVMTKRLMDVSKTLRKKLKE